MRVAIDAMGGDRAPDKIVKRALSAAASLKDIRIFLVGNKESIDAIIRREVSSKPSNIDIVEASQVVAMDEKPAEAMRKKPDSSVKKAAGLMAKGEADAFISAGYTAAAVAATTLGFGLLDGVLRPGK